MTNDMKLAMVIGVGLVVAVGILFYHKELVTRPAGDDKAPANVGNPPAAPPSDNRTPPRRSLSARPTSESTTERTEVDGESVSKLAVQTTVSSSGP